MAPHKLKAAHAKVGRPKLGWHRPENEMMVDSKLAEIRSAYFGLLVGQAVVRIWWDIQAVEFSQTDKRNISVCISSMESQTGGTNQCLSVMERLPQL